MWGSMLRDELPHAEAKASFSQTDPSPTAPNDQVVQHLDPKQLSGRDNLAGHRDVFAGGRGVGGGVIVREDDRGGVAADRLLKDFGDTHG